MPSLYIHIPFRRRANAYSEEYYVVREDVDGSFVEALTTEIEWYGRRYAAEAPVDTIYIGGGEPSILTPAQLDRIFGKIGVSFDIRAGAEITLEAHPADVSSEFLKQVVKRRVNRVSLGVESFFDDDLTRLECRHSAQEAKQSLVQCARAQLSSFNVDLRFGMSEQPVEYWAANLELCVEAGAPHISTYRVDSADQSRSGKDNDVPDESANERYEFAVRYLENAGYIPYELSHFAKPGHASRQLLAYWDHSNYLGFGPSAHSFWRSSDGTARRWSNLSSAARYAGLIRQRERPLEVHESLSDADQANEFILFRLQTREGLDLEVLRKRYGVNLETAHKTELSELTGENLIEWKDDRRIRLTREGQFLHEPIASRLLIRNEHVTKP